MTPYLIAGSIAFLFVLIFVFVLRRTSTPSVAILKEIRRAILAIQASANGNISPRGEQRNLTGVSMERSEQVKQIGDTIRFEYTIDEDHDRYIHTISSELIAKRPMRYQIQCMLVAMMTLNQQFEAANIDPRDIRFDINQSESGTHSVVVSIPADAHVAMMASRDI